MSADYKTLAQVMLDTAIKRRVQEIIAESKQKGEQDGRESVEDQVSSDVRGRQGLLHREGSDGDD
jgi:hypothetical protein